MNQLKEEKLFRIMDEGTADRPVKICQKQSCINFNYRNVIRNHPRQEASKPLIKLASVVSTLPLPHWKWNNLNNVSLKSMLFSI